MSEHVCVVSYLYASLVVSRFVICVCEYVVLAAACEVLILVACLCLFVSCNFVVKL